MERLEKLQEFIQQYDNINFNSSNIPKVMGNLERADKDGKLLDFLMNKKPYQSAFVYFGMVNGQPAARGKDQCAIVFALNFYGMKTPGFAARLNDALKTLAKGSAKQANAVFVLRNAQLELQELDLSLIDFFDVELLTLLNSHIRKKKAPNILLCMLMMVAGAIGAPGLAIAGLAIFSPVAGFCCMWGIIRLVFWCALKPLKQEIIDAAARPVREFTPAETTWSVPADLT